MKHRMATIMLLLAGASGALAQSGPDVEYQSRFLAHKGVMEDGPGPVGWLVASDTANPVQKGLVVGGEGYKGSFGWIEVMAGTFIIEGQKPDPVVDFRSSFNLPESLNLSVELLRAFRTERTIASLSLTRPIPGTDGRLRAGVEADLIFREGPDSKGGGFRIAYKFSSHVSLAVAYQFRFGVERDFIRSYCLFSF